MGYCSSGQLWAPIQSWGRKMLLPSNGLMVANAILAGILVAICLYGPRFQYLPFIRVLFLAATALFLPIFSYVASNAASAKSPGYIFPLDARVTAAKCDTFDHSFLILLWACLVQIVGINTCAIVAADNREGRNMGLPVAIVVQTVWISYIVVSQIFDPHYHLPEFLLITFVLAVLFAKIAIRYYAFQKAKHSLAFRRNPRLIVGYMAQAERQYGRAALPPRLIVMGEDRLEAEKGPHGFCFKWMTNQGETTPLIDHRHLVTIDKVWGSDDMLLTSVSRLKEVCLSFALFKLLRCRFAAYTVAEAGFQQACNFFWQVLLENNDHERVFGVITDELSFLYQYYHSSYPVSYSNCWLPILNVLASLLTIIYSIIAGIMVIHIDVLDLSYLLEYTFGDFKGHFKAQGQLHCSVICTLDKPIPGFPEMALMFVDYGNILFDVVPVISLILLVVLAEARDMASYICSNWTKVTLVCHYIANNDTWQQSPSMQKWLRRVLRSRCKLMNHWDDTMNQCSVLVLQPRKTAPVLLMRRLLNLPDKKKNVKVPTVVKAAIVNALRSNNDHLANPATFLHRRLEDGANNILWACEGKGIADIILMWHIATSILEVRWGQQQPASHHMIVANHLSRYCAYLVAFIPELLPDDDEWCKSLYKAIKKDSVRALAGGAVSSATEAEYDELISLMIEKSKHEVLKKGAELAKQLGELTEGEETRWRLLAEFWSEMILYIAPSDNLNGHLEAIARGGELITLCWALLMHAGISSRSNAAGAAV